MASPSYLDGARDAALAFGDSLLGLARPRLRIGVTGLSRSGKTVFTTALIQNLVEGARLPVLKAAAEGRIARVRLAPQPDADVPRFPYEAHRAALSGPDRRWPDSTRRISELRLEIDYERAQGWFRGPATLTLDIVDYPGEWLLDLALIGQDYAGWSAQAITDARKSHRLAVAAPWLEDLKTRDPAGPVDEMAAEAASERFKAYLAALRADPEAVAVTPPGRFLMPGDLDGSPALTFAPLELAPGVMPAPGTLAGLMAERFEAYKRLVVTPFFREHFARLDRQIVLVDALAALDAGPAALADLETALGQALSAFAVGRNSWLSSLFAPRIERVLFAATKADHIHHTSHDRLANVMSHLVARAAGKAQGAGAKVEAMAFAAIRATREVRIREGRDELPAIAGVPEAGEVVDGEVFDGKTEAAIFPGELPQRPEAIFDPETPRWQVRAPRFRPPLVKPDAGGRLAPPPQIRLDRALEFLIGDRLA
ncbi:YcjX family protein [Bosea sp. (in: a-proteobacteria)]|uniref:YcjX family protein n=1 Tax=Bosea sp. (in: a-proteobacteria) TaxID=1871050 RepID=UPI002FC87AAD